MMNVRQVKCMKRGNIPSGTILKRSEYGMEQAMGQAYAKTVYSFPASKPDRLQPRDTDPALMEQLSTSVTALYSVMPVASAGGLK